MMRGGNNKGFKGYRSYPIYLERVNNYMAHIRSASNQADVVVDEAYDDQYDDNNDDYDQNNYNSRRGNGNGFQQQQQHYNNFSVNSVAANDFEDPYERPKTNNFERGRIGGSRQQSEHTERGKTFTAPPQNGSRQTSRLEVSSQQSSRQSNPMGSRNTGDVPLRPQRKKITSSDLRNRRNQQQQVSQQQQQHQVPIQQQPMNYPSGGYNDRRKGPQYSVKLSIGSGAYQSDCY